MNKYRIISNGYEYKAQKKVLWYWCDLYETFGVKRHHNFSSKASALAMIEKHKQEKKKVKWKIEGYY